MLIRKFIGNYRGKTFLRKGSPLTEARPSVTA